jgi:hypothetical protein
MAGVQRAVTPTGIKLGRGEGPRRTRLSIPKRKVQTAP